ncbi:MAG: glycosyltransferase family 39 protein [Pyrinomonadaceae bacterium]
MTTTSDTDSRIRPWYGAAVLFIVMLALSWHRWNSLIVDNGRETDMPLRLLNGEWLYRDIHFLYTPFSPYFNALLYWIFGPHLDTLAFSGIFFSILLAVLCYLVARKLMPPLEATLAVCLVIVLCIFKPAGNLILPYSFAALHGTVFSIASVLFLMRFADGRKALDLVLCGALMGLAGLAKQEFAFAGALTVTAYLVFLHRTNFPALLRDLAIAAIPALVIFVPVIAVLFAKMDAQMLIDDCHLFYTNIPPSLVSYNRFRSGLDHPLSSILQLLGSVAVCAAIAAALIFGSEKTGKLKRRSAIVFIASAIVAGIIAALSVGQWDGSPIRALPVLLVAMMVIAWMRRDGGGPLFIAAAYALAIVLRVILRVPSGGFSGSFFLPIGLCMIAYALLVELPKYFAMWTADEASAARSRAVTRGFVAVAIAVTMISFGYRFRTKYVSEVSAARGTALVEKESGPVISEALRFIEAKTAPGEFISVLPEGSDLAFLTGRRINFRHQVLLPDFLSEKDELDAIEALKRGNIRYVFITNRPMREFGAVAFGKDFYQTLGGYITQNYRLVKAFGVPDGQDPEIGDPRYFIKAYERKDQ